MLSKLKYAPFVALIAFVALARHEVPASLPSPAPQRIRAASWQPQAAPTVAFTSPAAEGDTSGAFSFELAFDAAGGANIAQGSLQLRASRSIIVAGTPYPAGHNLVSRP